MKTRARATDAAHRECTLRILGLCCRHFWMAMRLSCKFRSHIGILNQHWLVEQGRGSPYLQHRVATLLVQHGRPTPSVLSFSALFGPGCCCQLVCFKFGVLHFRLPLYTRNGLLGEHVLLLWFLALALAGCCCQLVCFEVVVLHFRLPIPETGRL